MAFWSSINLLILAYISANELKVDKNWGELNFPGLTSFGSMYLPKTDDFTIWLCLFHSDGVSFDAYPSE